MTKSIFKITLLTFILAFLIFRTGYAQGIVSEANSWNVLVADVIQNDADTEFNILDGDSTVGGFDYKILWFSYYTIGDWHQGGLLREDSGIVYFIRPDGLEGILYNYNLGIGDTCSIINFCCDQKFLIYVTGIDTVEYFGIQRSRLFLHDDWDYTDYWIEGIGSIHGPVHTCRQRCNPPYLIWDLLCYHGNDTLQYLKPGYSDCIYTNVGIQETSADNLVKIYPNPARDKFEVRSMDSDIDKVQVFDMHGFKVIAKQFYGKNKSIEVDARTLNAGMYFCNIWTDNQLIIQKLIIQ